MMDEVSSLRTGRNSVYCVFAVDCDDDLMDRKENFLLFINFSCCWTSRSIDMNKMMAKQISIDAIFFNVYISIKLCVIHPILRCARQLDMNFYFFSRAIRLFNSLVISVSLWSSLIISQRRSKIPAVNSFSSLKRITERKRFHCSLTRMLSISVTIIIKKRKLQSD